MDEKAQAFGEKIIAVIESTCMFGILDENNIFFSLFYALFFCMHGYTSQWPRCKEGGGDEVPTRFLKFLYTFVRFAKRVSHMNTVSLE